MVRLAFFKQDTLIGRLIRFFTWGKYSHVALILEDGRVIDSYPRLGVSIRSVDLSDADIYYIDLPGNIKRKILADIKAQIGKKYDYRGVIGFLSRSKAEDPNRWFCSELIFEIFRRNGVVLLNAPSYKVSPTLLSYSPLLKRCLNAIYDLTKTPSNAFEKISN